MTVLLYFAAALAAGSVVVVLLGLGTLVSSPVAEQEGRDWSLFLAHLAAAGSLLLVGSLVFVLVERHRRAKEEATRLARQFDAVESYLEPLSPSTRDLVRVSLTPRLFSRAVWDDDPTREPIWPTAAEVLKSSTTAAAGSGRPSAAAGRDERSGT